MSVYWRDLYTVVPHHAYYYVDSKRRQKDNMTAPISEILYLSFSKQLYIQYTEYIILLW